MQHVPSPAASEYPQGSSLRHYRVDARAIDERPDSDGWYSSGRDVPAVYVSAFGVDYAFEQAHAMAAGWHTGYVATRTVVCIALCDVTGNVIGEPVIEARRWMVI